MPSSIKPPDQAPLSALRLAELVDGLLPAGRVQRRSRRPRRPVPRWRRIRDVAMVAHHRQRRRRARGDARGKRDGQAAAARAGRQERADRLSPTPIRTRSRAAAVGGMNFTWCGQSCGSTSRALHSRIDLRRGARARSRRASRRFQARCLATDPATTMGAIVSACSARSRARATSKPPQRKARGLRAWRQAAFGSRARWRLLCRAHACLRDVDAGDAHRARGDLRASAGDPPVVGRGAHDRRRERGRLRPHLLDLDQRSFDRAPHGDERAGRLRLDQRSRQAFPRRALRRRQAVGLRTRENASARMLSFTQRRTSTCASGRRTRDRTVPTSDRISASG